MSSPVTGSERAVRYAVLSVSRQGLTTLATTSCARAPVSLTTAIAPRPGGVEMAAIVSSEPGRSGIAAVSDL